MDDFDEVIKEFLVECYESLDQLDSDFVTLEENPHDRDRLASIFRTVHTIKGTSGFLAFPKLERVAHVGENLLVPLRDGDLELTHDMASSLLGMVDAIREILTNIESIGAEGDQDFAELTRELESLLHGKPAEPATEDAPQGDAQIDSQDDAQDDAQTVAADQAVEPSEQSIDALDPASLEAPNSTAETKTEPVASDVAAPAVSTSSQTNGQSSPSANVDAAPTPTAADTAADKSPALADSSIRIDVKLLDRLMNLVGELVLARNQVVQFSEASEDTNIVAASQRLSHITTELQEGVMKTRMQPIRNAWNKLPRVVRDLSASCGKDVEVQMEGADTELDKTILEALKDPLTHIVRNSVDHGIESAEDRIANGKPAKGILRLRAYHEGGQINIEITDDGGGINAMRVREKAIEKELVTPEQAEQMSDRELTNLILLPGFSTAAKVTNVSGRGVGMDVVKTNIERIGGTIDIQSSPGKGTTLRIKIPLTLAIVPALIVKTQEDQYAIPQVSLLELLRLDSDRARDQIEFIHETPVYRLRGNLLPLVYLDEQLELRQKRACDDLPESVNIVVLQAEDQPFGLVVDTITDTQEIVVKPLGVHLKNIPCYAGTTIMGDGTVALILDVVGLAHKSSILSENPTQALPNDTAQQKLTTNQQQSVLIVDPGDQTRAALQLSAVARLEEFDASKVERAGHRDVIQYRGQIMPLVYLQGQPPASASGETPRLSTVVFSNGSSCVGVVVGKIMDIVHEPLEMTDGKLPSRCVIQDHVTEVIDLSEFVGRSFPELLVPACSA